MENINKKRPTGMFIQPIFDYKPDEWLAMVYGWPQEVKEDSTFLMGFAFKSKSYAKDFFDLLRGYNNGDNVDNENNIRLSLITEDPENYSVYLYPSESRENVGTFMDDFKKEHGDDSQYLIASLTMCKFFPYGEGSTFMKFKDIYKEGAQIELRAFILDGGSLEQLEKIEPIYKNHIKIKHRKLLKKDELEYQHMKEMRKNNR